MAFDDIPMVQLPPTSHLEAVGYDPVARIIKVQFRKGQSGIYHGTGTTAEEMEADFNALVAHPHPGEFLHRVIKPKYSWQRV